jgi:hypothetical protein
VLVWILVFSELSCCLGEVAIDGKSLWRFPHISAIFAEVNATAKSIGKVQLEHYDNAMFCLTMVIKGVSKKARQDTRRDKCTDIGRTAPPTPWEVNAVMRKASPLVRMIVDRCVAIYS